MKDVGGHACQRLLDRIALVTGAGSGIGRAIAQGFADEGARVVVIDVNEESARETVGQIESRGGVAVAVKADVTLAADCQHAVQSAVDRFGGVQILVNNAGIEVVGSIVEVEEADWNRLMDVNLKGVYLMSRAAIPQILACGGGSIVNMGSTSSLRGWAGFDVYGAAKYGVLGLSLCMAMSLAPKIRVNVVCPGLVETPMAQRIFESVGDPEQARREFVRRHPLGRFGSVEDVTAATVHLVSDESSYVTGLVYVLDGGQTVGSTGWDVL